MKTARNPDIVKWECGRCGTWNGIDWGVCKSCGVPAQTHASAFRLSDTLSTEEKTFYNTVVPEILRELRSVKHEIQQMREDLYGTY
jgi:hypothetical protein